MNQVAPHAAFAIPQPAARRTVPMSVAQSTILVALVAMGTWATWTLFPNMTAGAIGNDALFLADGARRLAAGHMPHAEFSLPTGVLPYFMYLWAEHLAPQVPTYMGMHVIGFVLLAPLLIAAMSSMPNRLAALALLTLTAVAALVPIDVALSDFYGFSFHASYNRLGSALALVMFAWLFRADPSAHVLNAVLISYALVFAFFLKIVVVGVIVGPVAVLALLSPDWRRSAIGAAVIAALVLAVLQVTTGIVAAYATDIRAMSALNAGRAPYFFASFIFKTIFVQALLAFLVLALLLQRWRAGRRSPVAGRLALVAQPLAMLTAIGALIFAESQGTGGLEFTAALGLLFAPGLAAYPEQKARVGALAIVATLLAGTLLLTAFESVMAVALARKGPAQPVAWAERMLPHIAVPDAMRERAEGTADLWTRGGETLASLEAAGDRVLNRSDTDLYLAQWITVDDALAASARLGAKPVGRVMTLGNVDFFGLALDAEPVKGTRIVHDVGRTILALAPDAARAYVANADTVFAPTCLLVEAPGTERMTPWFADALAASFTPTVLTPCWTMHVRTASAL